MMRMMVTGKKEEEMRKGPWTEEEDAQLVCCVGLFGERRWDVIARVSGLNRTGKSCRLRWVNYLHPGLKRGRITPQEEKLILDLHARWGNRWSRIARKLPGRTDNEIKNYWRTLMRKKAQERKDSTSTTTTTCSPPSISGSHSYSSLSSSSSLSSICSPPPSNGATERTEPWTSTGGLVEDEKVNGVDWSYPMDKIWEDMVSSEMSGLCGQGYDIGCTPLPPSPLWEYSCESLWQMDDDQERAQCGGAPSVWERE